MRRWFGPAAFVGAAVVALLLPMRASFAWGPEAHRTIALIAERRLQQTAPATLAKVRAILATDKEDRLTKSDLASEATWADVLLEKSPEARTATTAWHSTRLKPDNPDLAAACYGHTPLPAGYPASRGPWNNCSVDKIGQFEKELQSPGTASAERLAALQFLLSIVADLNDPLHAIDHGDQGGACIALQVNNRPPVRLATYWQDYLVHEVVGSNPASAAVRIAAAIPAAEAQKWVESGPTTWAQETYTIAKAVTYSFTAEKPAGTFSFPERKGEREPACASVPLYRVGVDYETKALAAVKLQLARAGVSLARVLHDSLQ